MKRPIRPFHGNKRMTILFLWALIACASLAWAQYRAEAGEKKRTKVIDFEDEVVEGVNKRPLDSVSQISDAERRRRKMHLYRKRGGFRSETAETLRVLRYTP